MQDLLLLDVTLLCEWVCRWLVMSWRDPMEKYFRDSGIVKCNVGVVLVGGSAWFPFIKKLMQEFFYGKEHNRSVNSDEDVSSPFMRSRMIFSLHCNSVERIETVVGRACERARLQSS